MIFEGFVQHIGVRKSFWGSSGILTTALVISAAVAAIGTLALLGSQGVALPGALTFAGDSLVLGVSLITGSIILTILSVLFFLYMMKQISNAKKSLKFRHLPQVSFPSIKEINREELINELRENIKFFKKDPRLAEETHATYFIYNNCPQFNRTLNDDLTWKSEFKGNDLKIRPTEEFETFLKKEMKTFQEILELNKTDVEDLPEDQTEFSNMQMYIRDIKKDYTIQIKEDKIVLTSKQTRDTQD